MLRLWKIRIKQTVGAHPIKEPELNGHQWIECPESRFAVV